jgi:hypothetical protein
MKGYWNNAPLLKAVNTTCERKMFQTVVILCNEARRIVPVATGNLKGSLVAEVARGGRHGYYGSNKIWRGEEPVPYAINVEAYTKNPQPYLRPPLESKRREVQNIWGGAGFRYQENPLF